MNIAMNASEDSPSAKAMGIPENSSAKVTAANKTPMVALSMKIPKKSKPFATDYQK